jgi:hypothetical protein
VPLVVYGATAAAMAVAVPAPVVDAAEVVV